MNPGCEGGASRQVRTLFHIGAIGGLADGPLLERFAEGGEAGEMAFAALVERHGPAVLRACRAILRDEHEARDAFQATFLVLVRRVGSLRGRETIGPWLHGVARRVASCARSARARRWRHEAAAAAWARPFAVEEARDDVEVEAIVHEEVDRLPHRYRAPLVLCDLQGLTRDQAAARLRIPPGTVQSRLARGRSRLRDRLARRGLVPSLAAAVLSERAARASLPAALGGVTTRMAMQALSGAAASGVVPAAVASLTEGVIMAMRMTKLKACGLAAIASLGLVVGADAVARQAPGDRPGAAASEPGGGDPTQDDQREPGNHYREGMADLMRRTTAGGQMHAEVLDAEEHLRQARAAIEALGTDANDPKAALDLRRTLREAGVSIDRALGLYPTFLAPSNPARPAEAQGRWSARPGSQPPAKPRAVGTPDGLPGGAMPGAAAPAPGSQPSPKSDPLPAAKPGTGEKPRSVWPPRRTQEDRLDEVERKLDRLIESLERSRGDKPGAF